MEFRFYEAKKIVCPECLQALIWCKRIGVKKDSMQLRHPETAACSRSKKFFYPPVLHLTEFDA